MNSFARRQVFKKITFERCKTALTAQIWKWEILTWLFLTLILMNSFARRQVFKKITFERCKTALTA